MRKKSHKRTIPINMREKEAKRVFIFVIEHNTNTINVLPLPFLYSNLDAIKLCLLTEKYARKKNLTIFILLLVSILFFYSEEYKRKKGGEKGREFYIYLIFRIHSEELFHHYYFIA
jgi:hypothetical protein